MLDAIDPVDVLRDVRVDPRLARAGAPVTVRHEPVLHPAAVDGTEQGAAGVSLGTRDNSRYRHARAYFLDSHLVSDIENVLHFHFLQMRYNM